MGGAVIKIDDGQKKKLCVPGPKHMYVKKKEKKKRKKIKENRTYGNKMYGNTIYCFHYKWIRLLNC